MALGEPLYKKLEREKRMAAQYSELRYSSPDEVMQVDNYRINEGKGYVSEFSRRAMQLARYAAETTQLRALDQPEDQAPFAGPKRAGVPRGVAEAFPEAAQGRRVYESGASGPSLNLGG